MLKLKLQHFGHLMRTSDSLEKTLMLERLKEGGEGDDRGWDGWMASPTLWTWIWVSSGNLWWAGKPGVLQSMGLQRFGHDWATKLTVLSLFFVTGCTIGLGRLEIGKHTLQWQQGPWKGGWGEKRTGLSRYQTKHGLVDRGGALSECGFPICRSSLSLSSWGDRLSATPEESLMNTGNSIPRGTQDCLCAQGISW